MNFDTALLEGLNSQASISEEEIRFVYTLAASLSSNAVVLELGVFRGRSACVFADIAKKLSGEYYGIDNFKMSGASSVEAFDNLKARGLDDVAWIITADTQTVRWDKAVDLLHVDACHDDPWVSADIAKFLPFVKVEGIVAFDDYVPGCSVIAASNKFCANGKWQDLGQADGMKCWRRVL